MTTRTTGKTVRFHHAFTMAGSDGSYPAGEYLVQTDEELLEQMSFPAWKRVATTILLQDGATTRSLLIDPAELERMLERDATAGEAR